MSKKRRLAEGFSPDAIAGRLAEKTRIQEEMEDIVFEITTFRLFIHFKEQYNTIHYRKPSLSRTKRKSLIIIQIQEAR